MAFLVGVDFDFGVDVHLSGHTGLVVAASYSDAATVWKMNPPAGNMVVLCVRVFLVWAFLFVALGEAEASDASEQEALSTSSASVKVTDDASTTASTALRPEEIQDISPKQRAYLMGDWFGLRPNLAAKGVVFSLISIGDSQGNITGGSEDHIGYFMRNIAFMEVNLEKLAGWNGSEFFATGVYAFGDQTSANYLHNYQNISSIAGNNTLRLNEAWWEQHFGEGFDLRFGQLAAQDEFALQDFYATFINNSFGNPEPIGSVNASFTPAGKPGARLRWSQETGPWYAQTGIYDGDPEPFISDRTGFGFRTNDEEVLAAELGYRSKHFFSIDHRQGDYKMGLIRNFGDFTGFDGMNNTNGRDFFYGMAEQTVWSQSDAPVDLPDAPWARRISPFGTPASLGVALTAAGSPDNEAYSNVFLSVQLRYKGLFPARPDDVLAGGFEYAKFSDAASQANETMGGSYLTGEKVAELTYRFRVTPYFAIQPDLQYVMDPSGVSAVRDELVLGVRTSIKF